MTSVEAGPEEYFGIHIVDEATGRAVPLVELRTVHDVPFYTDSAGWVAFQEPGLMNRETFLFIESPGYEMPKDGFGNRGVRVTPEAGKTQEIRLHRTNIAERCYRVTGEGIYRDSVLLGKPAPIRQPLLNAGVLGQDSVQAVPFAGRIFWLWGDTNLPHYPLGNFRTTAATSVRGEASRGIDLDYFVDGKEPHDFRAMVEETAPGPVWLFGLLTVADETGREALVAHYSRQIDLAHIAEHGLVRFDESAGVFKKFVVLEKGEQWRFPRGNALRVHEESGDYFYFAAPLAHTRVRASWAAVCDPRQYEALAWDAAAQKYAWTATAEPTTQEDEAVLLRAGTMRAAAARYQITDAATGGVVVIHGGSIAWNEFRHRWVLIGDEKGGPAAPSFLGEMWYAEAESAAGPWRRAVKIATHPRYSFYNPRHHVFFDEEGGRRIYFEGTYTRTFSGNPTATPRYDYNQIMYLLDLADPRLGPAR